MLGRPTPRRQVLLIGGGLPCYGARMAKYDPMTYKYLVTDTRSGKKYKSMTREGAAKKAQLDHYDFDVEGRGGADTDTHNVKVQSYGKKRDYAFR